MKTYYTWVYQDRLKDKIYSHCWNTCVYIITVPGIVACGMRLWEKDGWQRQAVSIISCLSDTVTILQFWSTSMSIHKSVNPGRYHRKATEGICSFICLFFMRLTLPRVSKEHTQGCITTWRSVSKDCDVRQWCINKTEAALPTKPTTKSMAKT